MSGTTAGIIVICVVVVAALVTWLLLVRRAAGHQAQEHSRAEPGRGLVQGGRHVGGGRSIAPTRDAPVPQGGGDPPSAEAEDAGVAATKEAAHRLHSGSQSAQRPKDPAEWSGEPVDRSEQAAQQSGRPNSPMDL
jgi:hypothetical protein